MGHVPNDMTLMAQGDLVKMSSIGKLMMKMESLFVPGAKETVEMIYEFDRLFIADSHKFEKTFGVRVNLVSDAIKETVEWYEGHPEKK